MPQEPAIKRAIAFFDAQNLYHCAREAFGYSHPNFDPMALSHRICTDCGWHLKQVRLYTGFPSRRHEPFWAAYWQKRFLALTRQGIWLFKRELRYRTRTLKLSDGTFISGQVSEEKGIDVRLALDIVRLALNADFDVALIFSQDQDLSEVADEVKLISRRQGRWIKIASAFPVGSGSDNTRGINGTQWIQIEKALYDACLDPRDYRP